MSKYHKILGLRVNASKSEVKKAYFKLAKKYHPDVNESPDAEEKFIKINEAYEYLTNPKLKTKKNTSSTVSPQRKSNMKMEHEFVRQRAKRYAHMSRTNFINEKSKEFRNSHLRLNIGITILWAIIFLPVHIQIILGKFTKQNDPDLIATQKWVYFFIILLPSFLFVFVAWKSYIKSVIKKEI